MSSRLLLAAWPVVTLVAGAFDTVWVRTRHANQPFELSLFLHALALWGTFAMFGVVAARLASLVVRRRRSAEDEPRFGRHLAWVAFWTSLPVVAHAVLDRHTSLGQDVSALFAARPWLETAGVVLVAALVAAGVGALLARVPGALLGLGLGGLALGAGLFLPRPDSVTAPPGEGATDRPNLLLLVWDTTRWDHTSPAGYSRETTPRLARFAEEALVFENARSVSVFTFTSHLSMLTGLYPAATGARLFRMQVDPELSESVAVRLNEAGYRTGAFVGTWVLSATTGIQWGFEVYDDAVDPAVSLGWGWRFVHDVQAVLDKLEITRTNGQPHWFQDFQRPAADVLERALAWIERDDPRPWFCFVNLYDVHWPYLPDVERAEAGSPPVRPYDGPMDGYLFRSDSMPEGYEPQPEDDRHVADLYDLEMWELDRRVAEFLEALDLDDTNTAVLVTSDHGEAFGEGGRYQHEDILEPQVRIPMMVRLPASARGELAVGRRTEPVSGVDVGPTLLSLAGLAPTAPVHGVDLLDPDALDPERPILVEDRDQPTDDMPRLVLYDGPWKLVRSGRGEGLRTTLHDLRSDPVGLVDLAAEEPERLAAMEARLDELRAPWAHVDDAAADLGPGANADALGGLGYLGDD